MDLSVKSFLPKIEDSKTDVSERFTVTGKFKWNDLFLKYDQIRYVLCYNFEDCYLLEEVLVGITYIDLMFLVKRTYTIKNTSTRTRSDWFN